MKFLSNLLKSAAQSSSTGAVTIPYIQLQKYFQLFVGGIYAVRDTPPLSDSAINIPGQILKSYGLSEADDFFSNESSFTTVAEFNNGNGGHTYHGEYVTHGKDGGAVEYIYIVIASSQTTEDKKQKKFTPHFAYLGGCMAGEQHGVVHTLFLLSQSEYDGQTATHHIAEDGNLHEFVSALAYADVPLRAILSGEKIDADDIAANFSNTPMVVRYQKFDFLVQNRTPAFLSLEMNT